MIPVVDLARRGLHQREAFLVAVERVLAGGQVLLGPELRGFEEEFAAWTGHAQCVAVASGATAIQLALRALGVGPGDEVIVPAHTAVPTASAVCALGAVPVPADVDEDTATLDPVSARAARTDRTRAVVPVHLYGHPSRLPDLGVPIVEDAAQAHGALEPGSGSAAVAYSFYPTKNLGGIGDGGAVVTDDGALAERLRRLRVHGMAEQYVHTEISQNFRMSEIEAAWLRLSLGELEAGNARRRAVADRYRAAAPGLRWHPDHPRHVRHLCVVRVADRERFRAELGRAGIGTGVHYPLAITQQPAYRHFTRVPCPQAEAWAAECVSLPCFPELTDDEVDAVCTVLAEVADQAWAR